MGLRLTLRNGSKVLLDLPLDESDWNPELKQFIIKELAESEADLDTLCEISRFFSNKRRVQILSHIIGDCDNSATFTDLLKVAVNPKYVSDLVNKPPGRDIVIRNGRGYSVSPIGVGSFLLLSLAARRVVKEIGSTNSDDKSFEVEKQV
jgi:hypothetical protein